MILSPEVYKKIKSVVFTRLEPSVTTVFWARPSTPEGNGFDFFVYDNGEWQLLNQYENVIIPKVDAHLSAFINDVNFYSIPLGGIPLKDLSNAVQNALNSAYQIPSTGIPKSDLSSSVQSSLNKADSALQEEIDPTVPSWAKSPNKPSYTAQEVGALPANTPIPTNLSDLTDDLGNNPTHTHSQYLTSHQSIKTVNNQSLVGEGNITINTGEDNVQSDWNQTDDTADDFIKNKPTIPAAQVNSDWNAVSGVARILNKPDIPTVPTISTDIDTDGNDDTKTASPKSVKTFVEGKEYLTQHQDISGKEDVTTIVAPVNETDATLPITTLTTEVGKYYRIDVPIETLAVTLPAMTDNTTVRTVVLYLTGGTTPAVTITSTAVEGGVAPNVYYQDGFEIEAGKTYEVNCLWNGAAWIVASVEIIVQTNIGE